MSKMPSVRSSPDAYHHGNLERALVAAGLAIVEEEGIEALSLRGVARRANVSHNAPYHHFAGKAELLAAVAAAGFEQMVASIQAQAESRPLKEPLDALRAVGRGYVAFAVQRPSVFRLMFRPEMTRPQAHPPLLAAEALAFGALLNAIVLAQQAGAISGTDPLLPAAFAWSSVHGLAMLHMDGVFAETPLGQRPFGDLDTAVQETIVAGLRAQTWA